LPQIPVSHLVGFVPMPALGTTIERNRRQPHGPFDYYLRLADALFNRPDESGHLKQLARSFGRDILNLATLAGRLLWYEGVTPDMWRSHDLVAVSVDAEAYFVMLQQACDIMADVIATLGTKPGQAPSDSFHKLNEWAIRHPWRLKPEFHFLTRSLPWFDQINGVRTKLVHRGGNVWVYTERTRFEWDIYSAGEGLRRGKFLLSTLGQLTESMLEFSKVLADVIMPRQELRSCEKKLLISGVYVPALYHLLRKYTIPSPPQRQRLRRNARILGICGGYVEAARLGYPDGFWWQTLFIISDALGTAPSSGAVLVQASDQVHDCKFVFVKDGKTVGVVACDEVLGNEKWLSGAAKSAREFLEGRKLDRAVLIGRRAEGNLPEFLPETQVALVIGQDPASAASKAVQRLAA
jgi:hypothetical protein